MNNRKRDNEIIKLRAQNWTYVQLSAKFGISDSRCCEIAGPSAKPIQPEPPEFVIWNGQKKYIQRG